VEQGLARHPDSASGHVVAARIYADGSNHAKVIDAAQAALNLDPGNGHAADQLSLARQALKKLSESQEEPAEVAGGAPEAAEPGADGRESSESARNPHEPGVLPGAAVGNGAQPRGTPPRTAADGAAGPSSNDEDADDGRSEAQRASDLPDSSQVPPVTTHTLAELYVGQGHLTAAAAVYQRILQRSPADYRARTRLEELTRVMKEAGGRPEPSSDGRSVEQGLGASSDRPGTESGAQGVPLEGSDVLAEPPLSLHEDGRRGQVRLSQGASAEDQGTLSESPDAPLESPIASSKEGKASAPKPSGRGQAGRTTEDEVESVARDLAEEGRTHDEEGTGAAAFAWGGDGTDAEPRLPGRDRGPHLSVLVIHGPNLTTLGWREPETYGRVTLPQINTQLVELGDELGVLVTSFQSNHEGRIIDMIEGARGNVDGIVINPGGLTHTSVALRDALTGSAIVFVEVHISNTAGRASFRRRSLVSEKAAGVVHGFGAPGYLLALRGLVHKLRESSR